MARPANLKALLDQAKSQAKPVRCTLCRLIPEMDAADREALLEALSDETMSAKTISLALGGYGVSLSLSAVSRHRRECPVD